MAAKRMLGTLGAFFEAVACAELEVLSFEALGVLWLFSHQTKKPATSRTLTAIISEMTVVRCFCILI